MRHQPGNQRQTIWDISQETNDKQYETSARKPTTNSMRHQPGNHRQGKLTSGHDFSPTAVVSSQSSQCLQHLHTWYDVTVGVAPPGCGDVQLVQHQLHLHHLHNGQHVQLVSQKVSQGCVVVILCSQDTVGVICSNGPKQLFQSTSMISARQARKEWELIGQGCRLCPGDATCCQCPGNTDPSHVLATRTLADVLTARTFPITWQHGPFPMSWQHRALLCPGNTDLPLPWQHRPFPWPGNTDLPPVLATGTLPTEVLSLLLLAWFKRLSNVCTAFSTTGS